MAQPWEKVCRDRLTLGASSYRSLLTHGVVAQLGERLNGIQEVVSSILSSSTRFLKLIQVLNQLFLLHGDAQGSHRIFRLALSEYMVVLFQQCTENICFFSNFPLVGSVIGGFYWLFLWNFKEIKHQPFSMIQPSVLACRLGPKRGRRAMKAFWFSYDKR